MADAPIGVLGTGAVGCMMAALLHEAGHDVVLVARDSASSRRRGERLRSAGLRFERRGAAPAHLAPAVLARMLDGDRLGACDAIIEKTARLCCSSGRCSRSICTNPSFDSASQASDSGPGGEATAVRVRGRARVRCGCHAEHARSAQANSTTTPRTGDPGKP